jgi:hypothetical protein
MAQDWDPPAAGDTIFSSLAPLLAMLETLKSCYIGATLPTVDLVGGMIAIETTNGTVNRRNAANSAWVVIGILDQRFCGLDIYAAKIKTMTSDAEASDMIRTHIDVEDRGATQDSASRRVLDVWVGTADMGLPSATGNTVTFNKGTILETVTANAHYRVLSDSGGEIEIDLTVSGVATRYVMASLANAPVISKLCTFA